MPGLRDLKRRIKGIQSMRKITRAMQMVSAAKMRKAQNAVVAGRTYADLAWELILDLSPKIPSNHSLLGYYPKAKKIGVVILGTNGGLVGSLNSNLAGKLKELDRTVGVEGLSPEVISEVVVYGKKAKTVAQRMKKSIVADFQKNDKTITTPSIFPLAKYISDSYATGQYSKIVIVYNHFLSTLVQKATIKQLLPFEGVEERFQNELSEYSEDEEQPFFEKFYRKTEDIDLPYLFEPTPQAVLEHLLPRIIESQLYETILESNASEHSARMVMMKNATEAAGDLIDDLTLTYNQLRQGKITTELAEITAGRIALE